MLLLLLCSVLYITRLKVIRVIQLFNVLAVDIQTAGNLMKTILALFAVFTVGCTTYPKNYVFNPSVSVSGNDNTVILSPSLAKPSNPQVSTYKTTYRGTEPSPLTTYVPPPPPSTNYYYQPQEESQIVLETSYPNRW
jgi:hypothetical protein